MNISTLGTFVGFALVIGLVALLSVGSAEEEAIAEMSAAEILDELAAAANEERGTVILDDLVVSGASVKNGSELTYVFRLSGWGRGDIDRHEADEVGL